MFGLLLPRELQSALSISFAVCPPVRPISGRDQSQSIRRQSSKQNSLGDGGPTSQTIAGTYPIFVSSLIFCLRYAMLWLQMLSNAIGKEPLYSETSATAAEYLPMDHEMIPGLPTLLLCCLPSLTLPQDQSSKYYPRFCAHEIFPCGCTRTISQCFCKLHLSHEKLWSQSLPMT